MEARSKRAVEWFSSAAEYAGSPWAENAMAAAASAAAASAVTSEAGLAGMV